MDFNYSDLQRMLLDSAERFIAEHFTLERRRHLRDSGSGLDDTAWNTFAELGWLALAIPDEFGGLGGSPADVSVLAAALGSKCVSQPFVTTAVQGVHFLANAEVPRTELLEQIAGGTARLALVHTEPGERYANAEKRQTQLKPDGQDFRLTGQKFFAPDAALATHFVVSAELPGEGFALVLVEAGADGIDSVNYPLIDGSRASDIAFNGTAVSLDAILAKGPDAAALLVDAQDKAMTARLAQAVGSMEEILRICSSYLKERKQFGQQIGKFQALQHIMADMFVATHQSRSALYQALANSDKDRAARSKALALAGITIGEASQLVSRQGIQLHGGYGVTDEYEISHHYRYLLTLEKIAGDIDHHIRRASGT
ncbi:acyl-CoA dehydrogenase family protein [Novosphingobium taihuense]|uniref:Alkylation response protein AidB-like acyl-CoA dehydrogenase n=1 Tax=Novosphingobium taihuense TaxID=260085 RepID=A0A7W7EUA7_9SPHN|nr:acyl-CoA dehydrogenase family protein [Novosphingobium taihuense]MBB4614208.1 alkylation response protein AidB-like acyl-CoA dehydrogenase [Novosphingobium taihuense]TWH87057.1 alkylation response protein AidB-like acyl-CoA dehydrogenase [Novosphingobium taihuense]